jgi:hypothetical protein
MPLNSVRDTYGTGQFAEKCIQKHTKVVIHGRSLLLPTANITYEEQKFLEKNSRELAAACSASILSAFLEEDNVFSICCSTGELPLLTPWCRVLLEKLTGLQLVKKFPAFHGT